MDSEENENAKIIDMFAAAAAVMSLSTTTSPRRMIAWVVVGIVCGGHRDRR